MNRRSFLKVGAAAAPAGFLATLLAAAPEVPGKPRNAIERCLDLLAEPHALDAAIDKAAAVEVEKGCKREPGVTPRERVMINVMLRRRLGQKVRQLHPNSTAVDSSSRRLEEAAGLDVAREARNLRRLLSRLV